MVTVRIPSRSYLRCRHRWRPRKSEVIICPKCKNRHCHEPRRNEQDRRSDLDGARRDAL
jgi:hypothetical protein